jgi:hypothetical protein
MKVQNDAMALWKDDRHKQCAFNAPILGSLWVLGLRSDFDRWHLAVPGGTSLEVADDTSADGSYPYLRVCGQDDAVWDAEHRAGQVLEGPLWYVLSVSFSPQ